MIVRSQFSDTMLADALPMIDLVIHETEDQYPEVVPLVFNRRSSSRALEQVTEFTGLGQFVQSGETEDLVTDAPEQAFDKTYTMVKYRLGFQYSREALADGKHREIQQQSRNLMRSAIDTRETLGINIFNNGFADSGPDGVSLFNASHPKVKVGGVQSNTATAADLDVPSLMALLTVFRQWETHSGIPARIVPRTLLIPSDLEFTAVEILRGDMRSDTANHTVNALTRRVGLPAFDKILMSEYLTDPDQWQILAAPSDTGLAWYDREKLEISSWEEHRSDSAVVEGKMRFDVGYERYYGVAGNPGA